MGSLTRACRFVSSIPRLTQTSQCRIRQVRGWFHGKHTLRSELYATRTMDTPRCGRHCKSLAGVLPHMYVQYKVGHRCYIIRAEALHQTRLLQSILLQRAYRCSWMPLWQTKSLRVCYENRCRASGDVGTSQVQTDLETSIELSM